MLPATATFAISQAKATVFSVNVNFPALSFTFEITLTRYQADAAASIKASQVQAITATQAAIAIVGSIIGSSLLSILAYFLLSRYKKRKRLQHEQQTNMEIKTAYVSGPPNVQNRASSSSTARSTRMSEPYVQPPSVFEFTLPRQEKRPFWSFGSAKDLGSINVTKREIRTEDEARPSTASRKPTLAYNPGLSSGTAEVSVI